jgi:hypothetical protein
LDNDGAAKMSSMAEEMQIKRLSLNDTYLHIYLENKLVITAPLDKFPVLDEGSAEAQAKWKITEDGIGIRWEELDFEVSLPEILGLSE